MCCGVGYTEYLPPRYAGYSGRLLLLNYSEFLSWTGLDVHTINDTGDNTTSMLRVWGLDYDARLQYRREVVGVLR
jgi:hypothetical protein